MGKESILVTVAIVAFVLLAVGNHFYSKKHDSIDVKEKDK